MATDSETKAKYSPELLRKIFKRSALRLVELAEEGSDELLEMIHKQALAAQDAGKQKLVVSFSHAIKVDFGKNTQEDTLGGSTRLKLALSGNLDDELQGELFGEEQESDRSD